MKKIITSGKEKERIITVLNKLKNLYCVKNKFYTVIEYELLKEKLNDNLADSLVWARFNNITIDLEVLKRWEEEKGILYQGTELEYELDCDYNYCRGQSTENKLPVWEKWAEYLGTSINQITVDGSWYSFFWFDEEEEKLKLYPADKIFSIIYFRDYENYGGWNRDYFSEN